MDQREQRTRIGMAVAAETARNLRALVFVLGREHGRVIDEAIECRIAALSPEQRERFDLARRADAA